MEISQLVLEQRRYFESGATRSTGFRQAQLEKLRDAIASRESEIAEALKADFNKPEAESYMTETGIVLGELRHALRHLAGWNRQRLVPPSLSQLPGYGKIMPEPYGVALIIAPWNYPFQLCIEPLIGAIAAGNCVVLKPSAYAPHTSALIAELARSCFEPRYIAVVEGGRAENTELLKQHFDYIFFTGSPDVGQVVMRAASERLTPVTLELGGKSPVIVDETCDLKIAAKRIAFGKTLNAGQTCVAPDYLLIKRELASAFVEEYRKALDGFFPGGDMSDMAVIISDKHFVRVSRLLQGQNLVIGGETDPQRRFIAPALLFDADPSSPVMQEEIFGPLLPLIPYDSLDECIDFIRSRPKPLALYLFTKSRAVQQRVFGSCSFGGGCVNDVIMHLATSRMPFGGVGASGMGSYHGKASFDCFTHYRSILVCSKLELPQRFRPYTKRAVQAVKAILK